MVLTSLSAADLLVPDFLFIIRPFTRTNGVRGLIP